MPQHKRNKRRIRSQARLKRRVKSASRRSKSKKKR